MKWPLIKRAIPDRQVPLYNRFYLHAPAASQVDPIMVWGTEIDADALQSFLRERNRNGRIVITTAHALIRATALALEQFPKLNVRFVGRRLFAFRDVNIRMAFFHRRNSEMDLLMISNANLKSLEQIGLEVWQRLLQAGRGEGDRDRDLARLRRLPGFWFRQTLRLYGFLDRHVRLPTLGRLDATRASCVTVNDLSFAGAPPMRSYKPTRFPDNANSFNLDSGTHRRQSGRTFGPICIDQCHAFVLASRPPAGRCSASRAFPRGRTRHFEPSRTTRRTRRSVDGKRFRIVR